MKKQHWVLVSWLFLLYMNGVTYFLQGFLLTRREIHLKSSSSDGVSCCLEPKYKQIIILIIDALRYDFILFNNDTNERSIPLYQNNLPIVHQLLQDNHGVLYQFVADPPTSTMQRLKGITTGSLPTFIDVGSNFASDELIEDNIISQVTSAGLNVTFMGDDTWMGLFPNSFSRSYPFPSFDVWDIHSVDRGVDHHIQSEIIKKDWNLLIAHCLGVDHTGHRYGPDHPSMPAKLKEMNALIEKIIDNMNSQTLLLVMGDHGMTKSGDHGGDSPDEVNAGFFAYSPGWDIKLSHSKTRMINQVDLVPTLSLLMGLPIPYSNLGSVILDLAFPEHLWQDFRPTGKHARLITLSHFSDALYLNCKQVWRYLQTYSRESPLPGKEFQKLISQMDRIVHLFDQMKIDGCVSSCASEQSCCSQHEKLEEFVRMAQLFLSEAKEMCRSMWARFDLSAICVGLAIFASSLFLHWITPTNCNSDQMQTFGYFGIAGAALSIIMQSWPNTAHAMLPLAFSLTPVTIYLVRSKSIQPNQFGRACLVPLIMAASYTSNSFVIEEPYVVHSLAQSLIWLPLFFRRPKNKQSMLRITLSLSTRLGLAFFRCREEQYPTCESHNLHRSLTSLSGSNWIVYGRLSLALASCIILYILTSRYVPVDRNIGYLGLFVWCYWIAQSACFLFGAEDSATLVYLPRIFYFALILNVTHRVYRILFDAELAKVVNYRKQISDLVALLSTLAILLAGDGLAPSIILSLVNIVLFAEIFTGDNYASWEMWSLYGILSVHGFFATGHHTSLANIPWETAFVGVSSGNSEWSNLLPTFFVSYSTAFSFLLHAMAVPIVALSSKDTRKRNELQTRLANGWHYLFFFHAVRLFGCMGAAALHRRHLMVWKIFAPRLLYELLFAAYTTIGITASLFLCQATM